jgi:hypothetical protein
MTIKYSMVIFKIMTIDVTPRPPSSPYVVKTKVWCDITVDAVNKMILSAVCMNTNVFLA